jgi:hypothetical protein
LENSHQAMSYLLSHQISSNRPDLPELWFFNCLFCSKVA